MGVRQSISFEERLRRKIRDEKRDAQKDGASATAAEAAAGSGYNSGCNRAASTEQNSKPKAAARGEAPSASSAGVPAAQADVAKRADEAKSIGSGAGNSQVEESCASAADATAAAADVEKAATFGEYELEDVGCEVIVRASLPGVETAAQADMEVSRSQVRLWNASLGQDAGVLRISLPKPVDPDTAAAKWSKKNR